MWLKGREREGKVRCEGTGLDHEVLLSLINSQPVEASHIKRGREKNRRGGRENINKEANHLKNKIIKNFEP